ncbi:MAG: hypothetical protein ACYDEI_00165 [Erysipelotrichaceae bacterium]
MKFLLISVLLLSVGCISNETKLNKPYYTFSEMCTNDYYGIKIIYPDSHSKNESVLYYIIHPLNLMSAVEVNNEDLLYIFLKCGVKQIVLTNLECTALASNTTIYINMNRLSLLDYYNKQMVQILFHEASHISYRHCVITSDDNELYARRLYKWAGRMIDNSEIDYTRY